MELGMPQHIVIAGATGQVGSHLLGLLASRSGDSVHALVRRAGSLPVAAPHIHGVCFDFEDPTSYARLFEAPCDVLFIALGTTLQQAGGRKGLERVDRDYPIALIQALNSAHPHAKVGLVSSVGADRPFETYLRAKHAVEQVLFDSGLACAIARPSFLRSSRVAFRPAEMLVGKVLAHPWLLLGRLFPRSQWFWKVAPIHVREVAAALVEGTLALAPGEQRVLEGLALRQGPISRWGKP
jgi:uncharacterized protein YbjT (DUF2867 family)